MASHKVAAGYFGSHLSWALRFEHVAKALSGLTYNEQQAKDDWAEARATRVAPEAYLWLLSQRLTAALQAVPDNSDSQVSDDDLPPASLLLNSFGKLQPLPKWCLAREVGAELADQVVSSQCHQEDEQGKGATLWLSDVPENLASEKRLNEILYGCTPSNLGQPFVRKVVRQGYRASVVATSQDGGDQTATADAADAWLGYAFVAFRDKQEASEALKALNGLEVQASKGLEVPVDWTIRADWAQEQHQGRVTAGRKLGQRLAAAQNPPLGEQLFPTSLPSQELAAAFQRHYEPIGLHLEADSEPWVLAEVVKAYYRKHPRLQFFSQGHKIPMSFVEPLLEELRRTRWPPAPHRSGMQTEQYLVLHRGKPNQGFEALLELLDALLAWADPDYGCNRIAVTKDFQGSPHVDFNDVTYQYAVSLGSFDAGGELCVEGRDPASIHVVDTHDRIAQVDGRFVHWVRGHSGGDRFSLIFFSTMPACATEQADPVDASFLPAGMRGPDV